MKLISHDLQDGGKLPNRHVFNGMGYDGDNISPHLMWDDVPAGTKSFVVTCYDPDAPTGSGWWHWVVANLPADTRVLPQGPVPVRRSCRKRPFRPAPILARRDTAAQRRRRAKPTAISLPSTPWTSRKLKWMPRPAAQWSALTSISIPSPAPPSPPCSVNLPRIAAVALSGLLAAPFVFRVALRLPDLQYPQAHASAAPPGDCRGHGAAFMPGGG